MAFFTASYQHLLWTPTYQGPKPFGLVWLSLPHLVYLPHQLSATQLARWTQLSYIIVRRPLDLWNWMFNRHQVEITVMQFRGHSLPVHQSMSVLWEFFSSFHFISQFPPTRFPFITAIRMCHLLPVHHLGMAFLAGSKGQNITHVKLTDTKQCWLYLYPNLDIHALSLISDTFIYKYNNIYIYLKKNYIQKLPYK